MGFSPNLKKMLLIGTIILLGCDVSMLFAAEGNNTKVNAGPTDPELSQLQSQVQAQIKAIQTPAPSVPSASVPPPSMSSSMPNIQPTKNNLLPASPFNSPGTIAGPPPAVLPPAAAQAQQQFNIPPPAYQPQGTSGYQNVNPNTTTVAANASPIQVTENDVNDAAFNSMVQNALPMSPDQIQKLRSVYMASQFAAANSPSIPPRPTASSVFVDLSPGSTPPVVRLAQGFITSLVFVDSTGSPWPIDAYDIGNPSAFNIQWDKTSNTLMIQSTVLYTYGNLAVKLKGLDTPVMITLIPGQKAVDYRIDMRVQGYGPNAKPLAGNSTPASTSSDLLNVLDGVPPPNSKVLKVEGSDCQAWLANDKMYVRTRLSVLSPGWTATLSSADGMHAYEMQQTPMLLVSQNGQVIQLKVDGF
jgi:intracellular multiplication protein IcmK